MVQVDMSRTLLLNLENDYVVLLRGSEGQRALAISVGQSEAQAIAIRLNNLAVPRPLTHDLFRATLEKLGWTLARAVVCDLREETFYARLFLRRGAEELEMDARPSDAIALALRCSAPVFIEDAVMAQAGVLFTEDGQRQAEPGAAEETPSALLLLQQRLARAVAEERYEEAARIRDEIRRLPAPN